jgi:hypothetical protein
MIDEFACEFDLDILNPDEEYGLQYDYDLRDLISTIPFLKDYIDFDCDFFDFFKEEQLDGKVGMGMYHVFVRGNVEFESSRDWESGCEEGGWVFEWKPEGVHIHPLKD